jgi:hypothetical protein
MKIKREICISIEEFLFLANLQGILGNNERSRKPEGPWANITGVFAGWHEGPVLL